MIGSHILFENYIGFTYIFLLEICICCIIRYALPVKHMYLINSNIVT